MKTWILGSAVAGLSFAGLLACSSTHQIIVVDDEDGGGIKGLPVGTSSSSGSSGKSSTSSSSSSGSSTSSTSSSSGSTSSSSSSSSGSSTSSSSSSGGNNGTCPTSTPVNASDLPWKTPAPLQAGACTDAQVAAMQTYLQNNPAATNAQFIAYIKSLSASCGACAVTDGNASTWGPLPTINGDLVTINIGACFALAGNNVACGKAIQNEFDCEFVACGDCADDNAFNTCRTASQKGACSAYVAGVTSSCAGVPSGVDNVCGSFFDSIKAQCVAAPVVSP